MPRHVNRENIPIPPDLVAHFQLRSSSRDVFVRTFQTLIFDGMEYRKKMCPHCTHRQKGREELLGQLTQEIDRLDRENTDILQRYADLLQDHRMFQTQHTYLAETAKKPL